MNNTIGKKIWAIAEGYIPDKSNKPEPPGPKPTEPEPPLSGHETVCILNIADEEAHIEITIYFQTGSLPVRISYRFRHKEQSIFALIISTIPNQFHLKQIMPVSFNRMYQLSFNTVAWIRGSRRMHYYQLLLILNKDSK